MDNFDQLFSGIGRFLALGVICVDEVGADMFFQYGRQQAVHGTAATCDLLQDIAAAAFFHQRAFDGIDLAADAPYTTL